jgi:hypothetical protein
MSIAMPNSTFAKTALLLAAGILAAACSSKDERSLVVLDVTLGTDVAAPVSVHLIASEGTTKVKEADAPWAKATDGILEVGLFIPSGVAGPVSITAKGMNGESVVLEGALAEAVALKVGGSVGPFRLVLNSPVQSPPAKDGGVDGGTSDAGASDAVAPDAVAPDAGIADTGIADRPAPDTGADGSPPEAKLPEAGTADSADPLDLVTADVVAKDLPLPVDVADANPVLPDGSTDQTDGVGATEAGHVPGWEPAQNIENDLVYGSYSPVVAVDPVSEHVYVAWVESAAVKVRRWNKNSGNWEKIIPVETRGLPQDVTIGADGNGNVIVAWCQGLDTTDPLAGVWTSRTSDGLSWGKPEQIATSFTWNLQLAVARNGNARVAYAKQEASASAEWRLYSTYYDGSSWPQSDTLISSAPSGSDSEPRMVINATTGDGILIFDTQGAGTAAVTLTGQTVSAPTTMNPNHATNTLQYRAIAMNRKGEGVFVWSESTASLDVMFARTYNSAQGWSSVSPEILSSYYVASIAVALDEQGNATIVWQQDFSTGVNMMGIHGKVNGAWSEKTPLETDNQAGNLTTEYGYPKLAIDASGNVLAVWRKAVSLSNPTTYGAYASRFAGGSWLPQFKLGQKTGLDAPEVNVSVADSGFGAATFYYYSDTTTSDPDAFNTQVAFFR